MRIAGAAAVIFGLAVNASAQVAPRFELGPVARVDGLYFEGGTTGTIGVLGVSSRVRVTDRLAIEGEVTHGSGRVERSYEGWFVSYVTTPNPSRDEVERFAPTARRTLGYEAGVGWGVALVVRDVFKSTVPMNFRVGGSGRVYQQTSDYVVLTIPEGIDPARVARDFQRSAWDRVRGGVLLGIDVPLRIAERFRITPTAHVLWGGPAQIGNTYREAGVGVRADWAF